MITYQPDPFTAHLNERINFRTRTFLIWARVDVVDTICRPLPFPLRSLSRRRPARTSTSADQSANCSPAPKLRAGRKWRDRDSAIIRFLCCAPGKKTGNVNFLASREMLPHLFLERGIIDSSRHALRTFDKLTNWQSGNPLSYTQRAITRQK